MKLINEQWKWRMYIVNVCSFDCEFECEFFMHFNTFYTRTCNYRMEIDRLHVVQDLFGDKSSCGFLTLVPGALLSLIYFHLIRHCMLFLCLRPRLDHAKEFFFIFEWESERLIKDHKMESVQQQRLLMIPHGHSSTFVSFFCPRNSLIISSTIHRIYRARVLSQKTTLEAPFCILMNFATRNLISCRYTRKINMWLLDADAWGCVMLSFEWKATFK